MRSRWLSTFSLLGILLIVLGIVGKVLGPRFVFDPGQIADGNECWYYMTVGVLMVLNGLTTPALPTDERRSETTTTGQTSGVRPLAASTVEKTTGKNV